MASIEEGAAALTLGDATGADAGAAEGAPAAAKPKKEKKPKEKKQPKEKVPQGPGKKKETKLGLAATKDGDFGEWYSQVVVESEMISYYDVSGCYILRPYSCAIWDSIKEWLDAQIKAMGVQNAYFPLFITEDVLQTEKEHVEGFAAEVAWVTKSGNSDLDRPIAIRPTSETAMYPYYAQWIRSHRDLPLRLNQWTNVVRWEFKNPTPFIRSREFLWQEGHTAFATREEADAEVYEVLDRYRRVYEELLAVPVCKGLKTKKEQFAGAVYTTTVEAFIPATGRGVQGATSHCLGQNFAKMFGIDFETDTAAKTRDHVWQNSWGMTTRTIGVMIMVHGDDKGVVMPPRVAPVQVVVIPIPKASMSPEEHAAMSAATSALDASLKAAGLRVACDDREDKTPGWKYNNWELKGVPLRVEVGPRDVAAGCCVLARRDTGAKEVGVPLGEAAARISALLDTIQVEMLQRARATFDASIERCTDWEGFTAALDRKHMALVPWCDEEEPEEQVRAKSAGKDAMGAKSLCKPLEQPELPGGTPCFFTGKPAKCWCLFGRSY